VPGRRDWVWTCYRRVVNQRMTGFRYVSVKKAARLSATEMAEV